MIKLDAGPGYFIINDESYPVGHYHIVYRGINVGIREFDDHSIVFPTSYMEWRDDLNNIYPDRESLLNDLRSKIFSRT